MKGDSEHIVVACPSLKVGELHRFKNAAGVDYSAVYIDGMEVYSCERDQEKGMIKIANAICQGSK
jgi:hypothetical protein